jgi:hypothetical protein
MLVPNSLHTTTTAAITNAQSTIPVASVSGLTLPTDATSYALLTDGVSRERVKITSISGNTLSVTRGVPAYSFVKGACLQEDTSMATTCEFIAQGGCGGSGQCQPVGAPSSVLPDAIANTPYAGVVTFPNATSISIGNAPSWLTSSVNGNTVVLGGTPPAAAVSATIAIVAQGCNASISQLLAKVTVCQSVGVA